MSLKFGQIPLLFSMATDRVIMEKKRCCHFFLTVYYPILFILAGNDDMHETLEELEFLLDPIMTEDLAPLEHLKKPHRLIMGKFVLPRFLSYS